MATAAVIQPVFSTILQLLQSTIHSGHSFLIQYFLQTVEVFLRHLRDHRHCNDYIVFFLSVLCAWKNHSPSSIVLSQTLIQASEYGLETPIQPCLPLCTFSHFNVNPFSFMPSSVFCIGIDLSLLIQI